MVSVNERMCLLTLLSAKVGFYLYIYYLGVRGIFCFRNSNKQGNLGVGKAINYFTTLGYTVSIPLTDSQEYDLVVDNENDIYRVQVKTTGYKRNNNYVVSLKIALRNNKIKKFDSNKSDFLYIVTDDDSEYLIPTKDISCTTSLNLGKQYNKYKLER